MTPNTKHKEHKESSAYLMFVLQLFNSVLPGHQGSLQVLPHLLRTVRLLADGAHVGGVGAEVVLSSLHLPG